MKKVSDLTADDLGLQPTGRFGVAPYEIARGPVMQIGDERVREITIAMPSVGKTTFLASWKPHVQEQGK